MVSKMTGSKVLSNSMHTPPPAKALGAKAGARHHHLQPRHHSCWNIGGWDSQLALVPPAMWQGLGRPKPATQLCDAKGVAPVGMGRTGRPALAQLRCT
jgi:hypothetical protein